MLFLLLLIRGMRRLDNFWFDHRSCGGRHDRAKNVSKDSLAPFSCSAEINPAPASRAVKETSSAHLP